MRRKKCEDLFTNLQPGREKAGINLFKCTPGSGKTFFAHLFKYYLSEVHKIKALFIALPENQADLENKLIKEYGCNSHELIGYSGSPIYIIIDEAQKLYLDYDIFWENVKQIGDSNPNVKILCFASYGSVRAIQSRSHGTPMCFKERNTNGVEFLKFDNNEWEELIESFQAKYNSEDYFELNSEMTLLIRQQTAGHPEITYDTLRFLLREIINVRKEERNFSTISNFLFSYNYIKCIIGTKSCPQTNRDDLTIEQSELVKKIQLHNGFEPSIDNFKIFEDLEKLGLICQNFAEKKYVFVSKVLGSILFSRLFNVSLDKSQYIDAKKYSKKQIVMLAVQSMKKDHFISTNNFKLANSKDFKPTLSEDQWVCEFFQSLRYLLNPINYFIICQASSEVNCKGEVDLYINGDLKLAIEITKEGKDVSEHLGRLYRNYNFSPDATYYVIDFRATNFYEVKENYTKDGIAYNLEGKNIKKNLIRVVYAKNFEHVTIYSEDNKDMGLKFDLT